MIWLAIEDADTCEVTEFEQVTEEQASYLMDGYRVNKHDITRFRQDEEDGQHIIYAGVTYKVRSMKGECMYVYA